MEHGLCEACTDAPAVVALTRIADDGVTERRLCAACARAEGVVFPDSEAATIVARPSDRSPPPPERRAAILASARPEIDAANAAWLPGLRERDATAIAAAYADSGLFVAGDGAVTRGRAAVARMYAARISRMRAVRGGAVVQDGLAVTGPDRVVEWGHAWLEVAPERDGGRPGRSAGTYVTGWQREADGHWRIVRNLAF